MNGSNPLGRIRIVLSRTSHPGNIGAAARAMKTMGLARLFLVEPRYFPHAEADARASGAGDVLRDAVVCASLAEALAGTVFAGALTARRRDLAAPAKWLREAAAETLEAAASGEVALVFGNEASGLSNAELAQCHLPVMIPTSADFASLNLGAAVQLACYELRMALGAAGSAPAGQANPASAEEIEQFYAHLERTAIASGFLDPAVPKRLMHRMRRLFARARLEKEEVAILRGMLSSFTGKVD